MCARRDKFRLFFISLLNILDTNRFVNLLLTANAYAVRLFASANKSHSCDARVDTFWQSIRASVEIIISYTRSIRISLFFHFHQFLPAALASNHQFSRQRCHCCCRCHQRTITIAHSLNKYLFCASARSVRTRCLHDRNIFRRRGRHSHHIIVVHIDRMQYRQNVSNAFAEVVRRCVRKVFTYRIYCEVLLSFIKWPP